MSFQVLVVPTPSSKSVDFGFGKFYFDWWLLGPMLVLLSIGLVMVGSASISIAEREFQDPFYYLWRQGLYLIVGLLSASVVLRIRIHHWEQFGPALLTLGIFSLLCVLIVGHEVNGSLRWISFGWIQFQPSEFMKLFVIIFLAGYFVKYEEEVRTSLKGFLKPMILLSVIAILLLMEPDFGAAAVIAMTVLGMMFLGGVKLRQFAVLFILMAIAFTIVAYSEPYRIERLSCFLNPWADPYDCGFQLTQSLIAFGRGDWVGVGLGSSIQKLFYLPEAHTDFLFAVLAEELGLLGGLLVILLFALMVWRAFSIGRHAMLKDDRYHGFLAYGLGLHIGIQAYINIGVNMGVLPTKGLTLPLMSYGGSSMLVTCVACAMLLRIANEHRVNPKKVINKRTKRKA